MEILNQVTKQKIVLQIPAEKAKQFQKMTNEQKTALSEIAVMLVDANNDINLFALMDFMGYCAQKRGITPQILEEILAENH